MKDDGKASLRPTITVVARVSFAPVDHLKERLAGVAFPVELALPHRYEWWQQAAGRMHQLLACLDSLKLNVATIHATQASISDPEFLRWGQETIRVADHVGARSLTVHPNRAGNSRANHQFAAAGHLRQLQSHSNAVFCVETFGGKDRLFRPEELVDAKLPMTLDVAHIGDNKRILGLIDKH